VCAVIGLIVARDNENGGVPSRSAANRAVQGIVAAGRPMSFSVTDGDSEGQLILAKRGGIIVGGQAGSSTAIADGGFVFIGTDTLDPDSLWRFYNVTRMRDFIHVMFIQTLRFFLGRYNLRAQTLEVVLNTMKIALCDLEADGNILGWRVGFFADKNSAEQLRLGKFSLYFKAEEPPVLRQLEVESFRYRAAFDDLIEDLLAAA
jgi:phage tail sheath protein FI